MLPPQGRKHSGTSPKHAPSRNPMPGVPSQNAPRRARGRGLEAPHRATDVPMRVRPDSRYQHEPIVVELKALAGKSRQFRSLSFSFSGRTFEACGEPYGPNPSDISRLGQTALNPQSAELRRWSGLRERISSVCRDIEVRRPLRESLRYLGF